MPGNIEERVVSMQFDNADFERNANASIRTLDKLDNQLKLSEGVKGLSNIETAVERVSNRFSTFGIVGATVISNLTSSVLNFSKSLLTAIPRQIISGGKQRSLNIEQAKFQLSGLGIAWGDIYDNIDKAVSGTAYGLDEAAKVASQLAASGIAYGDAESDMAHALRGISGVAAMTNSSYEEIGSIFTTVAGQGKLMTFQLRQLESRGLNAAANLGKVLGKTEEEVRDMVSKGKIDFLTFAKAMDDAFGEHATKANETFTGALSNMKAALSRIGADFAGPTMDGMRKIFNSARNMFNEIRKITRPFAENQFTQWVETLSTSISDILDNKVIAGIARVSNGIKDFFGINRHKEDLISSREIGRITQLTKLLKDGEEIPLYNAHMGQLKRTFAGFKAAGGIVKDALSAIGDRLRKISPDWEKIGERVLNASSRLGDWVVNLRKTISENEIFEKALDKIESAAKKMWSIFATIFNAIKSVSGVVKSNIGKIIEYFGGIDSVKSIWNSFTAWFLTAKDRIKSVFSSIKTLFSSIRGWKSIFSGIAEGIKKAFSKIISIAESLKKSLSNIFSGRGIGAKIFSYAGAISALFLAFKKFSILKGDIGRFKGVIDWLKGIEKSLEIPQKVSGFITGLNKSLSRLQENIQFSTIQKIATSLLLLAVALAILASIDGEKLGTALAAAAAGLWQMMLAMKVMNGLAPTSLKGIYALNSQSMAMIKIASAMILVAIAVKTLSKSVEKLGGLSWENLAKGLTGVLSLLAMIAGFSKLVNTKSISPRVGLSIIAMAAGILILTSAIEKIASLQSGLEKSVIALGAILLEIGLFSRLLDRNKIKPSTGLGMIAMAASILILVSALKRISEIDSDGLMRSLLAVSILMASMSYAGSMMGQSKQILSSGLAMMLYAASLAVMAKALENISNISNVWPAIAAVIALMAALGTFAYVMSGVQGLGAVALSFIVFAAAILVMANALSAIAGLGWSGILKGLAAIAGVFVILGVSAVVLGAVIPVILALGAALLLISTAILVAAAGIGLLVTAFTALAASGAVGAAAIVSSLSILANGFLMLAGTLGQGLALLIASVIVAISESIGVIAKAIADMIISVIGTLAQFAPELVKNIADLLINVFSSLGDYAPQILEGALDLVSKLLSGFATAFSAHAGDIFSALGSVLSTIIDGILGIAAEFITSLADTAGEILGAIGGIVGEVIGEIIGGIFEGISSHFGEIAGNLTDFVDGLVPVIDTLNALDIDPGKIEALKSIAEAILALTAAELLDGISKLTSWLTGGSSFKDFAEQLAEMGPAIAKYSASVSGIDESAIVSSAEAIEKLADVASKLNKDGGIFQKVTGVPQKLGAFADELGHMVGEDGGLTKFASAAPEIASQKDNIVSVAEVLKSLVDVANAIEPGSNGLSGDWTTASSEASSLKDFVAQLPSVGLNIKSFGAYIDGLPENFSDKASKVTTAIGSLVDLANALDPTQVSIFGIYKEQTPELGLFLKRLTSVAPALDDFVAAFTDAKLDRMQRVGEVFTSFATTSQQMDAALDAKGISTFTSMLLTTASDLSQADEYWKAIDFTAMGEKIQQFAELSKVELDFSKWGEDSINSLLTSMQDKAASDTSNIVTAITNGISKELKGKWSSFVSTGQYLASGLRVGILSKLSELYGAGVALSDAAIRGAKARALIASPSKVMIKNGEYIGEGFVIGIGHWLEKANEAGKNLSDSTIDSAMLALDYINRLVSSDMDTSMTIRPVLDFTDVETGMRRIDSLFAQRQAIVASIEADSVNNREDLDELLEVGWKILKEIQNGSDLYLDDKVLAGRINRRLGQT